MRNIKYHYFSPIPLWDSDLSEQVGKLYGIKGKNNTNSTEYIKMNFSSGKNVYIKKLEMLVFEPETYQMSTYTLRIMLLGPKKSSFGELLRLSFTGFHLASGHDFEIKSCENGNFENDTSTSQLDTKFSKKCQKRPVVIGVFGTPYFGHDFFKIM